MLTTTRRRRLLAALTLPLLVLLAGCGRFTADFEIQDVDTMQLSIDVGVETTWIEDEVDSAESMCADLDSEAGNGGVFNEVALEPYEEDGMWGCRASGMVDRSEFGSDVDLTEQDGEFHLVIAGDDAAPFTQSDLDMVGATDFEFRMSFSFPGSIIESSGGQVDGSTVTYTDIVEVSQGIDIRAEADGFPWLIVVVAVVLIGGFLLLVALAVVGFLIYRSRKSKSGGPGVGAATPAAVAGSATGAGGAGPVEGSTPGPSSGQPWGQASAPAAAPQDDQWSQPAPSDQPGQEGHQGWPEQPGQSGGNQQPPSSPGW